MTRLDEIRRHAAHMERAELVGFLAGLRMNGEWRDADVQAWIRTLPNAQALVAEAKRLHAEWMGEMAA